MRQMIAVSLFAFVALTFATFKGLSEYSARAADANLPVIKITGHKFEFMPNEIRLKKDESVILEFTSTDVDHGFTIPELKLRADLLAGKITRVPFTPQKPGKYEFYCDNFCGLDHENMSGVLLVE